MTAEQVMLWCRICGQQVGTAGQCLCVSTETRLAFDNYTTEKPR